MNQEFSDEIDLRQLARSVRDFLRSNSRILVLFALIGSALGLAGFFLIPPRYESQLVLQSDILTDYFSNRIAENFDRLIEEKNFAVLGQRLSLEEGEAKTLRNISIETVVHESTQGEELAKMTIMARVTDLGVLPKLQSGLLSYLRNIDFVKVRVRQREERYQNLIGQLEKEIRSLDSLKLKLLDRKGSSGVSGAGLVFVDPTNIYGKLVELHERRIQYKNALELHDSVQIMEGFTPFNKPVFPKLSLMLVLGFALGIVTGLSVSVGKILFYSSAP